MKVFEPTKTLLKELAEERYPDTYFDGAIEFDDTIAKFKRLAFISGCESQQGEAVRFAEWLNNSCYVACFKKPEEPYWRYRDYNSNTLEAKYTTEQLYNLFKSKK